MTVQELFRAGELKQAIQALGAEVRDRPTDVQRRTFLFELLCFAGDYSRAEKHLNILASGGKDAETGGLVLRSLLLCERKRQAFFADKQYEQATAHSSEISGKLNGEPFQSIEDADPRIGPRLELFLAGEYVWLPFAHVSRLQMQAPKLLRQMLWASGQLMGNAADQPRDFGEVFLPAIYPDSYRHARDSVKLGRETDWDGDVPYGQKLLVLDGERVVPFLEVRTLEFDEPESTGEAVESAS